MAVSTTDTYSGPYEANGSTVEFPFTFKAASASELRVFVLADGAETDVFPSQYTVTLTPSGGTVLFGSAPSGGDLYIESAPTFEQPITFSSGQAYRPETVNEANDRAAIRDLALKSRLDRAPVVPVGGGDALGRYPIVNADGTWGFSVGSGGGGAGTHAWASIKATEEGQTQFDFSAAPEAMLEGLVDPRVSINGANIGNDDGEVAYIWNNPVLTITDDNIHVDDVVTIITGVSFDQGIVDRRNILGLSDPSAADTVGSKYPLSMAAARAVGDRLSDRMPSIWDFYRPELGDTVDDWSPQMNRAAQTDHDIYFPTARRPQGYDLLSPVTQNAGGQMYYGDPTGTGPGSGTEFNIPATFPLGGNGVIIVPPNTAERGCGLADIGFRFFQPDTAVRASLIQYPPALYARNVARMQLKGRVTIYLGWAGFDFQGNNGGLDIDTLRMGCFSKGLIMDGAFDKTNINTIELWPYGCGAVTESQALYSIYSDGVAIGLELGRVDGFSAKTIKTFRQRIITRNATFDQPGTDGFGTIGELHLDGTYGRLEMGGGKLAVGSWYATTGAGDDFFVKQTGGTLALGACAFALGPGTDTGQALFQVEDGNFSYVGGGIFEAVARQGELFKQTGGDALWFGGNIRSGLNQVRTKAFFEVHGGRCTLKNPRFIDPGTGSGLCVKVTNDEWHDIEINATLTRGFEIPAAGGSGTYKFGSTVQAPVL